MDTTAQPTSLLASSLSAIAAAKADGKTPVVVFDLDGTLFDNGARTWAILAEFAEAHKNQDLRSALDGVSKRKMPYLLSDALKAAGFEDEKLLEDATAFWFDRFFTDDYQAFDVPLEGAHAFVNAVFGAGATIAYLTGRDSPGMLVGCAASLRQHGFPVGLSHTTLVLKPDFKTPDLAFKTDAIDFIDTLGAVVASFDNEPGNCNLFQEKWPKAINVFLDTTCAPGAPDLAPGILSMSNFESDLT